MSNLYTDYLSSSPSDIQHYGVLGMKWGIRKADEYSTSARKYKTKALKKELRLQKLNKNISKEQYNNALKRHKKNDKIQKEKNKQYIEELKKTEQEKVDKKQTIGKVGTEIFNKRLSEIDVDMPKFGEFIKYYDSIGRDFPNPKWYKNMLERRYISDYRDTDQFRSYVTSLLSHSLIDPLYLEHHGIDGQKWGVRRGPPYPIGSGSNKNTGVKNVKYSERDLRVKNKQTKFVKEIDKYGELARKEYLDYRKEHNEIDPNTGFYKKNKSFTTLEDRDIINIEKESFARGPRSNCVLCSVAFDARQRGQEVIANYALYGYTNEEMENAYKDSKDLFMATDDHPWHVTTLPTKESKTRYKDSVRKQIKKLPNNSRGVATFGWGYSLNSLYGGHAVAWEVKDKIFRIYDCQSGKTYTDEVDKIKTTDKNVYSLDEILDWSAMACISRTDNLEMNYDYLKKDGWLI